MFKDLLVFELQRTTKQAFGFYLAHLLVGGLLSFIAGALFTRSSASSMAEGFLAGLEMGLGQYIATAYCLVLSFFILFKKNKTKNFGLILIALLSGVVASMFSGLLGMIPAAYLTTLKPEE